MLQTTWSSGEVEPKTERAKLISSDLEERLQEKANQQKKKKEAVNMKKTKMQHGTTAAATKGEAAAAPPSRKCLLVCTDVGSRQW